MIFHNVFRSVFFHVFHQIFTFFFPDDFLSFPSFHHSFTNGFTICSPLCWNRKTQICHKIMGAYGIVSPTVSPSFHHISPWFPHGFTIIFFSAMAMAIGQEPKNTVEMSEVISISQADWSLVSCHVFFVRTKNQGRWMILKHGWLLISYSYNY